MVFVRFSKTDVGVLYFADEKRPDLPPRHDFAPIRAPETPKRHFGHGFAHFRASELQFAWLWHAGALIRARAPRQRSLSRRCASHLL